MSPALCNRTRLHYEFEVAHVGDPDELLELLFARIIAYVQRTGFAEISVAAGWGESITLPADRSPVPAIGPMT